MFKRLTTVLALILFVPVMIAMIVGLLPIAIILVLTGVIDPLKDKK